MRILTAAGETCSQFFNPSSTLNECFVSDKQLGYTVQIIVA